MSYKKPIQKLKESDDRPNLKKDRLRVSATMREKPADSFYEGMMTVQALLVQDIWEKASNKIERKIMVRTNGIGYDRDRWVQVFTTSKQLKHNLEQLR